MVLVDDQSSARAFVPRGFLPGWTLNVAHVIHSDEALLATGFIFVFHFFHTHLRPESFPMDTVVFTGKMPLSRFKAERRLEYQRLVDHMLVQLSAANRHRWDSVCSDPIRVDAAIRDGEFRFATDPAYVAEGGGLRTRG